jgi:hypothetical protein
MKAKIKKHLVIIGTFVISIFIAYVLTFIFTGIGTFQFPLYYYTTSSCLSPQTLTHYPPGNYCMSYDSFNKNNFRIDFLLWFIVLTTIIFIIIYYRSKIDNILFKLESKRKS